VCTSDATLKFSGNWRDVGLTGVLYDSIGSKFSMRMMFLFFAGCMAVVAGMFALFATKFTLYVPPTSSPEGVDDGNKSLERDDTQTEAEEDPSVSLLP
jgi:hypothetical protein